MRPPMLHTAYKLSTIRNAYGDFLPGDGTAMPCHFRYITQQVSDNDEVVNCDAMIWLEPDCGVDRKDLIKFEDEFFRVERVTKARRLRSQAVEFIKCELLRYGQIS